MFTELSEVVRQYAKALITHHHITPFKYPTKQEESPEFGADIKELKKQHKRKKALARKKKKGIFKARPKLLATLESGGFKYTEEELAQLAEKAKQAIEQASQLAGERVVYCCGKLRPSVTIDYKCSCRDSKRHKIINGW